MTEVEQGLIERDAEAIEDLLDGWSSGISPSAKAALSEHDREDLAFRLEILLQDRIAARSDPDADAKPAAERAILRHAARKSALQAWRDAKRGAP